MFRTSWWWLGWENVISFILQDLGAVGNYECVCV